MQQQILLIDDSKSIHTLVTSLLSEEPVTIHSAYDGKYGLTLAASVRPDLILLDVEMPGMDGYETCRQLKADAATASVPIIFLTAKMSTEEMVLGLNLGASDYVTKPFKLSELLSRARAALRTSRLIRLLENKALIDSLTGLGNTAMFEARFDAEMALRIRSGNALSIIMIDVDGMKNINEKYGHAYGDQVLAKIGETLAEVSRVEDVTCRYSGQEFVVLSPQTTADQAALLAGHMRAAIAKIPFVSRGEVVKVTCSLGVAEGGDLYDRSILDKAAEAVVYSKDHGRNCVSVAPRATERMAA